MPAAGKVGMTMVEMIETANFGWFGTASIIANAVRSFLVDDKIVVIQCLWLVHPDCLTTLLCAKDLSKLNCMKIPSEGPGYHVVTSHIPGSTLQLWPIRVHGPCRKKQTTNIQLCHLL